MRDKDTVIVVSFQMISIVAVKMAGAHRIIIKLLGR